MYFPVYRPRRLRRNSNLRELVAETRLSVDDFIYPMFVMPGKSKKVPITSMPGIYKQSIDNLIKEIREVKKLGIKAILLFGIPERKDEMGTEGYDENGIIQRALSEIKKEVKDIILITDVCMCEYTCDILVMPAIHSLYCFATTQHGSPHGGTKKKVRF